MPSSCRLWFATLIVLASLVVSFRADALTTGGSAWVRTPWIRGWSTEQLLTCANCQQNAYSLVNQWSTTGVGTYTVRFPSMAPATGSHLMLQASALNSPGVTCAVTGRIASGNDLLANVDCRKNGSPAYSRFTLYALVETGNIDADAGFANIVGGALSVPGSWASRGGTPSFSRAGVGNYSITFPGVASGVVGGNAQVTSGTAGVECRAISWGPQSGGTQVTLSCQNASGASVDADVCVSFNAILPSTGSIAYLRIASLAGTTGAVTPPASYTLNNFRSSVPVSVYHGAGQPGSYVVTFNNSTFNSSTVLGKVSSWTGSSTCSLVDLDESSARVQCLNTLTDVPEDNGFSLVILIEDTVAVFRGYAQVPVNGTNFKSTSFDVGNGLLCGEGAIALDNNVICVAPSSQGSTGPTRVIGGGAAPGGGIKSIAIDNVDGTQGRVLVLGADNYVRWVGGDLTSNWPTASNFGKYTALVKPFDINGQSVALKEITVVRTQGSTTTDIVGLTNSGTILSVTPGGPGSLAIWKPTVFTLPVGKTFQHISHGRYDLYGLQTDGGMFRSTKTTVGGLNTLAGAYTPIAMGGRVVLTNAGYSGGTYPCTAPADSLGYYTCSGDANRMYSWQVNNTGRLGYNFQWPTTNRSEVLTSGEPFASTLPTIVDADMFEGNLGGFVAWQYFSRLYQSVP